MRKIMLGLAVFMSVLGLRAATYRVVATAGEKTGDWADAYTSLGEAVKAAAGAGDVVLVKSGTYTLSAQLMLLADNITLRSDDGTGKIDPAHTIVQGNGSIRLLYTNGKATPTIDGFTFKGGVAKEGAGLYMSSNTGAYRILNCTIEGCTATGENANGQDGWGGAIYSDCVGGIVSNCVLRNNSSYKAKGERAGAAFYGTQNDRTTIWDCVVTNNTATGKDPLGGAVAVRTKCTVIGTYFADNMCQKSGNTNARGGDVHCGVSSVLSGCTFAGGCRANYAASVALAGTSYMTNCTFTGSVSETANGLVMFSDSKTEIVGCRFTGVTFGSELLFVEGGTGGQVRNSLFAGNDVHWAVRHQNTKMFTMENCTIANNTWNNNGKVFHHIGSFATNVFVNCLVSGGVFASGSGEVYHMTNCCIEAKSTDGLSVGEIVTSRPGLLLVDGNYLLQDDSPCVDAGVTLPWTDEGSDLAGRARTTGAAVDIGCFERQATDPACVEKRVVRTAEEKTGEWADALVNDIQGALDAVGVYGVVRIKGGTYPIATTLRFKANQQSVVSDGTAILDGSGLASGALLHSNGQQCPAVRGLTFRNARAGEAAGGALKLEEVGAYLVADCVFEDNAAVRYGGAIRSYKCAGGVITNCQFYGNRVTATTGGSQGGGALYSEQASSAATDYISVLDCTFSNNCAIGNAPYGGAITTQGRIVVDGGLFVTNFTTVTTGQSRGGMIYNGQPSEFRNVTFRGYVSANYGSVVCGSTITMADCTFEDLFGGTVGYGFLHPGSNSLVENCTARRLSGGRFLFLEGANNTSIRNVLMTDGSSSLLTGHNSAGTAVENCTFANNSVTAFTSSSTYSTNRFVNSILLGTVPGFSGAHVAVLSNCFVSSQWSVPSSDVIVGGNPGFRGAVHGDFRLTAGSACLDKGLVLGWTAAAKDLDGRPRLVGAAPDLGCYERQPGDVDPFYGIKVVATDAEKTGDWADAVVGLAAATAAAANGDTVVMKGGTYDVDATVRINNKALTFRANDGDEVVWDAKGLTRCLAVTITSDAYLPVELDGITFRNGFGGVTTDANWKGCGGGLYLSSTVAANRIVLRNCTVEDCRTDNFIPDGGKIDTTLAHGGGICAEKYVTFEDCLVRNCFTTNGYGGGVFVKSDSLSVSLGDVRKTKCPVLERVTIENCQSRGIGGAGSTGGHGSGLYAGNTVWVEDCDFNANTSKVTSSSCYYGGAFVGFGSVVRSSRFTANYSDGYGGALDYGDYVAVTDCVFARNHGGTGVLFGDCGHSSFERCVFTNNTGDVLVSTGSSPTFRNCLFAKNGNAALNYLQNAATGRVENCTLVANKIGVQIGQRQVPVLVNSIVLDNTTDFNRRTDATVADDLYLTNCCVKASPGIYSTEVDCLYGVKPGFVNAAAGDYRLRRASKCREKGLLLLDWMTAESVDLAGLPRLVNRQGEANAADALPDLGCYESQERAPGLAVIVR